MLPIALQVYSVRDDAEKDFKGTMQKIKEMGYEGVELAGLYGYTAEEVKSILDEVGLQVVSAHVPVQELLEDDVLDAYATMGLSYIAIPWMSVEANEQNVAECVEVIKGIAKRCKERGMQLLYHNHDFEFQMVNEEYILDCYYREVPADLLQTELDTCWVKVAGVNPVDYIKKYTNRAPIVHLKDFVGEKSKNMYALIGNAETEGKQAVAFEFRPVGFGVQDMSAIVQAAEEAGAKWLIVEQDNPSMQKSALECVEMSIKYLKA